MDDVSDWCDLQLASLSGSAEQPQTRASDERAYSSDPINRQALPSVARSPSPPATQPTSSRSSRAKSKEPADDEPWGEPWFLNVKAADIPSFAQLYNVQEKVFVDPVYKQWAPPIAHALKPLIDMRGNFRRRVRAASMFCGCHPDQKVHDLLRIPTDWHFTMDRKEAAVAFMQHHFTEAAARNFLDAGPFRDGAEGPCLNHGQKC